MSKEIPITFNGNTIIALDNPESIGRAEAILREEQGVDITEFVNELTIDTLEKISLEAQKAFSDPSLSYEEKNRHWMRYSRVNSRLTKLRRQG